MSILKKLACEVAAHSWCCILLYLAVEANKLLDSASKLKTPDHQWPTLGNSTLILAYSGAIILHGPHHFAVKSRTDTLSAVTTSRSDYTLTVLACHK